MVTLKEVRDHLDRKYNKIHTNDEITKYLNGYGLISIKEAIAEVKKSQTMSAIYESYKYEPTFEQMFKRHR